MVVMELVGIEIKKLKICGIKKSKSFKLSQHEISNALFKFNFQVSIFRDQSMILSTIKFNFVLNAYAFVGDLSFSIKKKILSNRNQLFAF